MGMPARNRKGRAISRQYAVYGAALGRRIEPLRRLGGAGRLHDGHVEQISERIQRHAVRQLAKLLAKLGDEIGGLLLLVLLAVGGLPRKPRAPRAYCNSNARERTCNDKGTGACMRLYLRSTLIAWAPDRHFRPRTSRNRVAVGTAGKMKAQNNHGPRRAGQAGRAAAQGRLADTDSLRFGRAFRSAAGRPAFFTSNWVSSADPNAVIEEYDRPGRRPGFCDPAHRTERPPP
jgi:hypothetical protein